MRNTLLRIVLFFIGGFSLASQELPPINIYTPDVYKAENQNWSITQSNDHFIYIANNKGLLEFNGADWTLYPSPNGTIVRSVNVIDNKIYTGFYRNFGYWTKDEMGLLSYTSLTDQLQVPLLEDEQFWNIIELDGWILFQSLQRIYLYNQQSNTFSFIEGTNTITKMAVVDGVVYFQEQNTGLFKISNGKASLVSANPILKENILAGIFQKDKGLLLATQDNGLFVFSENQLTSWNTAGNTSLKGQSIYSGIALSNGGYAFGTISNGFYNISKEGAITDHINQPKGLSNNTVLTLFEDLKNNIWLGLDNGINTVNLSSPFRIYKDKDGFLGTIYAAITHKEYTYLGTNQGLFFKKTNSTDEYRFIQGTQGQVWTLTEIDNTLFCGHNSGTFIVKGDNASLIAKEQGTWNLKKINDSLIIQGNYSGLHILKKVMDSWEYRNKIKGFNNSSRFIEFSTPTTLFVNHEYKGVFKLTLDTTLQEVVTIVKDTSATKGIYSSLVKYQEDILYANKLGVFTYIESKNSFQKDSIYSALFKPDEYTSGKLVYDKKNNTLWSFTSKNLGVIYPSALSTIPKVEYIPISESKRKGANGFENIVHIKEEQYLIGTANGYIVLDLSRIKPLRDYEIHLLNVQYNATEKEPQFAPLGTKAKFKSFENNIAFSFSTPFFSEFSECEYQYKLVGESNNWSPWTNNAHVTFKNLNSGSYQFHVRSRIGDTLSRNVVQYDFTIEKEWYLANGMVIIYVFCIIIFSLFMHQIYKRYYTKKQEVLLDKAQKEMKLQELEDKQEIMRLRNEKLQTDIENTNKELATATMSIIKKNEFLNGIKKELKSSESTNFNKVIKIIDKNLNNTDDWKLFQEAFNNADKDFLKKVKTKHPSLTPNDLRLCAYLRLNLSSKEIAPLLNISPRSVEVKRYRLRKKMNLSHDSSLTNYILEI